MNNKFEKWSKSIVRLADYKVLSDEDPALWVFIKSLLDEVKYQGEKDADVVVGPDRKNSHNYETGRLQKSRKGYRS